MTTALDLTDVAARVERDRLADRTEVLDRVGVLRCLPDDLHVTTDMVAEFYQVPIKTIQTVALRNREELDTDGLRVVSRRQLEETFNMKVTSSASSFTLYTRRAVLRVGMLLRDSEIAQRVRDYLLDAEQSGPRFVIPQSFAEALRLAADEHEARELAEAERDAALEQVAELEPKAHLADDYLIAQGGARLVRQVAKTFGLKEHELRDFLVDQKVIFKRHLPCGDAYWDFYAQFAHYFLPREHVIAHQWGSCTHYTLTILPRGVELIGKRLRDKGVIS